jgi:hypothetical protein
MMKERVSPVHRTDAFGRPLFVDGTFPKGRPVSASVFDFALATTDPAAFFESLDEHRLAASIYDLELEGGVSHVGKTSRPLFKRTAEHLLAGKRVKAVTRIFLDWGGLNAADAEATVLADVLRSKGIVGKLGSEGVLARIANKISQGVSRLCP